MPHHSVVIVGAGPTGLTLANLLGAHGVDTVLVERHATTVTEPRAVSIDDESLRTMQAAGAVGDVLREVVPGTGSHYHGPNGRCFARVEPTGTPFGYPRRNAFRQPVLEQQLRDNLARFAEVQARFGWQLTGFADEGERVRLDLRDPDAGSHEATCDFLVGADGASSLVRELVGSTLGGTTFDERWLIVDLERHPNAARHTRVFCDIRRPCITLPGPQETRRFEFRLLPGERDADLLAPDMVARLLADHGADPGASIRRKVVYHFHARVADRWSRGRVFLAGDAAHLTPPFAGQGMNSGIRDAQNLAWKLAAVLGGQAGPGLLDSYARERREHVWSMIRLALRMGRIMAPPSRLVGLATRAAFTALRLWPPASDYVLQMKYKPKPRFTDGFVVAGRTAAGLLGRLFPQPYVVVDGAPTLLDDVLGNGFCLLGRDPRALGALGHSVWDRLAVRRVGVLPPGAEPVGVAGVAVVTAADRAFADAFGRAGEAVLLLRPDHYVAAAFVPAEADAAAAAVERLLDAMWQGLAPARSPTAEAAREPARSAARVGKAPEHEIHRTA